MSETVITKISKGKTYKIFLDSEVAEKIEKENYSYYLDNREGIIKRVRLRQKNNDKSTKFIALHKYVLEHYGKNIPERSVADHIRRNPLKNRIKDLRVATRSENSQNKTMPSRDYETGIYIEEGRNGRSNMFRAYITQNGKRYSERFESYHEALTWRFNKQVELFGEFNPETRTLEEILKNNKNEILKKKPKRCDICERDFTNEANYANHRKTMHEESDIKCKTCDRKFKNDANLAQHMKTHQENNKIKCEHCDKMISGKSNMIQHIRAKHKKPDFQLF